MNTIGETTFLGKELGPVTVGQLVAIVISFVIGLVLLCIDGANGLIIWVIVAIILYMLPHVFGAKPKTKAVYPVIFAVLAILLGAFAVGPAYISDCSSEHLSEHDGFTVDVIHYDSERIDISATYSGESDRDVYLVYCEVNYVTFKSVFLSQSVDNMTKIPMVKNADGTYGGSMPVDSSKLYYFFVAHLGDNGKIDTGSISKVDLTGFDFTGKDSKYTVPGSAYALLYVLVIFYLILGFTTFMRNRFASTRQKMEAQGRLYPQGYGRCNFCGAIVLPGEVNCRKCGAYIDRPESMKPHKHDYFKCSACGAEVAENMTECPKCGAKFDGEENEVTHVDGTVDVSSQSVLCPVCGKHVPANSQRCTYCGKKFDE